MKSPILFTIAFFAISVATAQFDPTPVGIIPGGSNISNALYIAYIDHDEPKYVHYDQNQYVVTMYNMDLTLFRQFSFPTAFQSGYPRIFHITSRMFDCDSTTVEYMISHFNPMESTYVAVIREDGAILLERQNAVYSASLAVESYADFKYTGIVNHDGHALLSIAHFGNNNYEIYQLCGELPLQYSRTAADGSGISTTNDTGAEGTYIKLYPVPSGGELRLVIPSGKMQQSGEARIYDLKGSLLQSAKLPSGSTEYQFDITALSPGIYLMSVTDGAGFRASRRFVKW